MTCHSAPFHFLLHQSLVLRHCLTGVPKAHNLSTSFGASRALEPISNRFSFHIGVKTPSRVQAVVIHLFEAFRSRSPRQAEQSGTPFPHRFEKLSTYERAKLLPCRRFNTVEKVRELPVPQTGTQAIMLPKTRRLVFYVHSRRLSSEGA